jgi:guanosine-3',5'-bis(diphosphate) 3'-pyrophosphohydrolase
MLAAVAAELRYADVDALYAAVGDNHVSAASVVARLVNAVGGDEGAKEDVAESSPRGSSGKCAPAPSEPGRQRRGHGFHGCLRQAQALLHPGPRRCHPRLHHPRRRNRGAPHVTAPMPTSPAQPARPDRRGGMGPGPGIALPGADRRRGPRPQGHLLADITRVLSDNSVNILGAKCIRPRSGSPTRTFMFEMGDPAHLEHVLKAVKKVHWRLRGHPRRECDGD